MRQCHREMWFHLYFKWDKVSEWIYNFHIDPSCNKEAKSLWKNYHTVEIIPTEEEIHVAINISKPFTSP